MNTKTRAGTPFWCLKLFTPQLLRTMSLLLLLFCGYSHSAQAQATVTSDKDDYAPLSQAVFTGNGFWPNESVVLKVKNLNKPCNTTLGDSSYTPWTVVADANGHFVTNWTVCNCNGDSLRLKATGQSSGMIALAYFTDALNVYASGISITSAAPSPYCQNASASALTSQITLCTTGNDPNGNSTNNSTITYTWYYNTTNSNDHLAAGATQVAQTTTTTATTTSSYTPSTTSSGTLYYFVRVTTPTAGINGCQTLTAYNSSTVAVTINATPSTPTVSAGSSTTFCTGGSVMLTSSSASGYQWYKNNAIITGATGQTYSATTTGSYTVITTVNSCPSSPSAGTSVAANSSQATATVLSSISSATYGAASASLTATVTAGTGTPTGTVQFKKDGSNIGSPVTLVGGQATLNYSLAGVNAGSYSITAAYSGAAATCSFDASTSSSPQTLLINKATPSISVSGTQTFTYTGNAQGPSTISYSGDGMTSLLYTNTSGPAYSSPIAPSNAGNYQVVASATAGTNYNASSSAPYTFSISKAAPTVTVNPYNVTYDGLGHTSTYTIAGVNGETGATVGTVNVTATTHTNAGTYGTDGWSFTGTSNYSNTSGTVANAISPAAPTVTVNAYNVTYDDIAHGATGTATGVGGSAITGLNLGSSFTNVPGGTANWTFSNPNYVSQNGTASITITPRDLTVSATGNNKVYDGTTNATVTLSTDKVSGDNLTVAYTAATFADANVGNGKAVSVTGISITGGSAAGNYQLVNNTATTTANITAASTTTTLITSAGQVRYMDYLTMTATVKPDVNVAASPLTGSVEFKIGTQSYGSATVAPIPGDPEGKVQATMVVQVSNLPANYNVTAAFASTNGNYSNSPSGNTALLVNSRNADPLQVEGFYSGDRFAWTTSATTSTASLALTATIKDNNSPTGDVRGAKVTFYLVNGTTYTPISSAQNLPVGLVDINDGTVGFATAIVQLNIGNANAQNFQIAVGISGGYSNNKADALSGAILTVSKPVTGGYIIGGGCVANANSNGYIRGHSTLNTDFQFDVKYNNSGANPQGKGTILVRSYYDKFGVLTPTLHTYLISSNAITSLNVTTVTGATPSSTGTFSSKANLVEQMPDGTIVSIEGNCSLQMVAYQSNCTKKVAVTLYRKAGGIWFSNNWVNASTVLQNVTTNTGLAVANGGTCVGGSIRQIDPYAQAEQTANIKVYPNPSNGTFNLELPNADQKVRIVVTDVTGKTVATENLDENHSQNIRLDLKNVSKGVYLLQVNNGEEVYRTKLIVE